MRFNHHSKTFTENQAESEPLVGFPSNTHQSLISKGIVNAPDEKPKRPQVLEPKLQYKIGQQNQRPNNQEL